MTRALRIRHYFLGAITYGVTFPAAVAAAEVCDSPRRWFTISFADAAAISFARLPISLTLTFTLTATLAVESFASDKGSNLAVRHLCKLLGS
jgi:hypothetical protein